MAKNPNYQASADPADFAPDFTKNPEPYGKPVQELIDVFDGLALGSHILDFAGGYGKYAVPLAIKGYDVTILDIHDASLAEAKRRSSLLPKDAGKLIAVKADIIREDIPKINKADAILCAGFIHHLNKQGVTELFDSMVSVLDEGGLAVIEFSTDKNRRYPDGTPILVDGEPEHNCTHEEGIKFIKELYKKNNLELVALDTVPLKERQKDFWYDAKMIIAKGLKL